MSKRKTTEQFIKESKEKHGDRYDYSLVEYVNCKIKVIIICKKHGLFLQRPDDHIRKQGCPACGKEMIIFKRTKTKDIFTKQSIDTHGYKYDYSLVNYITGKTKVKIICKEHGIFEQTPNSHLSGKGCSMCGGTKKLTTVDFIEKSINIHGNKYDYSLVNYKNNKNIVSIICPIHGVFKQRPDDHCKGIGCPKCSESKGEKEIRNILNNYQIKFESQKKFDGCKYKNKLPFDFYLSDYNICIEFDGEQHFKKFRFEKNDNDLKKRQKRDQIKNEYCQNNNIRLFRIRYDDDINLRMGEIIGKF
ncbi:MAG: hypothetical protein ACLFPJ_06095 [Candidatus Woesearchaeota archaeon]